MRLSSIGCLSILAALAALTSVPAAQAQNLVRNGDFSEGNTDFAYGYEYVAPLTDNLVPGGTFSVVGNPAKPVTLCTKGAGMFDYFDHTKNDASGSFMVVNGAGTPNTLVWGQRIKVKPYTKYYFSTWVSTWTPDEVNPARLQFSINGKLIGPIFEAPKQPGVWGVFEATWTSGASNYADISIVNQTTQEYGNDFGLDDIVFYTNSLPELKGRVLSKLFVPEKPAKPGKAVSPDIKPQ